MQSSAQEVTMLFKLIAAAKDSWACSESEGILILGQGNLKLLDTS